MRSPALTKKIGLDVPDRTEDAGQKKHFNLRDKVTLFFRPFTLS